MSAQNYCRHFRKILEPFSSFSFLYNVNVNTYSPAEALVATLAASSNANGSNKENDNDVDPSRLFQDGGDTRQTAISAFLKPKSSIKAKLANGAEVEGVDVNYLQEHELEMQKSGQTHVERLALIKAGINPDTMQPFPTSAPPAASAPPEISSPPPPASNDSEAEFDDYPAELNTANWSFLGVVRRDKFPSADTFQLMLAPSGCPNKFKQGSQMRKIRRGQYESIDFNCGCGNVRTRVARQAAHIVLDSSEGI